MSDQPFFNSWWAAGTGSGLLERAIPLTHGATPVIGASQGNHFKLIILTPSER